MPAAQVAAPAGGAAPAEGAGEDPRLPGRRTRASRAVGALRPRRGPCPPEAAWHRRSPQQAGRARRSSRQDRHLRAGQGRHLQHALPADGLGQHLFGSRRSARPQFCAQQRAMLIVDTPSAWSETTPPLSFETVINSPAITGPNPPTRRSTTPTWNSPIRSANTTVQLGPCGAVAGVWASTDDTRGVWKAPAGTAAASPASATWRCTSTTGERRAQPARRQLPAQPSRWSGRCPGGPGRGGRRPAGLAVEIHPGPAHCALTSRSPVPAGTQWVVFEPNDEPLWSADPAQRRRVHARARSGRGRSRAPRRARPTWSSATPRQQPAEQHRPRASSTSWSASRR